VCEALKGLDYAHRRADDEGKTLGIVHRDVSPSNLLVSFEGEVKVCDFGIARANDAIATLASGTAAHELGEALKGKAGYMSPEHARGQGIDARADVFAAGIMLWELAAGRRMYRTGEGKESLIEQARRGEIPPLESKGLPAEDKLRQVVARALARDREARYPSAAAMQRDLGDYAVTAKLMTSPLRLGEWLTDKFGEDIVVRRRARERASEALERGAPVVFDAITPPPPSVRPAGTPAPGAIEPVVPSTPTAVTPRSAKHVARPVVIGLAVGVFLLVAAVAAVVLRAMRG
jgi:serine/threonine-protein kinase